MTKDEHDAREQSFQRAQEVARRISKPRGGFRSIGEEMAGHEGGMIFMGVREGMKPIDVPKAPQVAQPAAPVQPAPAPAKKRVKVVRDEDGAITGFETE